MISQAVIAAAAKPKSDGYHRGQLTGTSISPCPYGTYINLHHLDVQVNSGSDNLRMQNGHWQELECLENIRQAGFTLRNTGSNQLQVHIGKAGVIGRPDGQIVIDSKELMLEIKAMSIGPYTALMKGGIEAHPFYKCQVQVYMAGDELVNKVDACCFYAKQKDSCKPYDIIVEKDLTYSRPILEATDEIVLANQEVKRPAEKIDLCAKCRHRLFCWKEEIILDTSEIKTIQDDPAIKEVIDSWKTGKFYVDYGKTLIDEARVVLEDQLADNKLLLVENLKVSRIFQTRTSISEQKFIEIFGANRLPEVQVQSIVPQMRILEV